MAHYVDLKISRQVRPTVRQLSPWLLAQLRAHYYWGRVSRGDRLPPVRVLARKLRVTSTTALQVYRDLEEKGAVENKERSGVFLRTVGVEPRRSAGHVALFRLLRGTCRLLKLQSVDPTRFTELLLRCAGEDTRTDFKFACCSCVESYEMLLCELRTHFGFTVPTVRLSPERTADHEVRALLSRDRSIRCVLTPSLHSNRAFSLAAGFSLPVINIRLEPSAYQLFVPPAGERRYIVTRDTECAQGMRQLACSVLANSENEGICSGILDSDECDQCTRREVQRLQIASLNEPERLATIDREAKVVYAPLTAVERVRARYGKTKAVVPLLVSLSAETLDDILFLYLFGEGVKV